MEKTVLLFCGGPPDLPKDVLAYVEGVELIICADRGAESCASLSVAPDFLVGDMDSVSRDVLEDFERLGVRIRRYPSRKDATDLELALDLALEQGCRKIYLVNSLGGRWDMSLANILLTAQAKYADVSICHLAGDCRMHILHPGCIEFRGRKKGLVSLLPCGGEVSGITLTGFEYALENETLVYGSTRGVSNIILEERASVCHAAGVLLCIEQNSGGK